MIHPFSVSGPATAGRGKPVADGNQFPTRKIFPPFYFLLIPRFYESVLPARMDTIRIFYGRPERHVAQRPEGISVRYPANMLYQNIFIPQTTK
ncbi:hypothetical protein C1B90_21305 [Salmonella enterica]|uniref:Uncharacterized protein n=1 Tax=Salmonella enterica TaxID=28901 RepID=A0A5T4LPB7_SALER|nr:hypothetical protein [Salmonella enterica]